MYCVPDFFKWRHPLILVSGYWSGFRNIFVLFEWDLEFHRERELEESILSRIEYFSTILQCILLHSFIIARMHVSLLNTTRHGDMTHDKSNMLYISFLYKCQVLSVILWQLSILRFLLLTAFHVTCRNEYVGIVVYKRIECRKILKTMFISVKLHRDHNLMMRLMITLLQFCINIHEFCH